MHQHTMALDAADHADIMKLSLEERVAQRVKDVKSMTKRPYAPAADPLPPKGSENRFAAPTNSLRSGAPSGRGEGSPELGRRMI